MIGAVIALLVLLGAGLMVLGLIALGIILSIFAFNLLLLSIMVARS